MTIRTALRLALSAILGTAAIAAADTTYLPGAAELTGLAGARFSSTLELSNPGATGTTATIGLVPMAGKAAPAPVARTLAAGESLRIPEALKTLFGLAEGAAGTLTLTSDEPLLANLSTRNVAAPEGAYGLGLLPVPSSDLLGAGETGHSIWVSQSADPAKGYRTNLSVTLVDPGTIVEVRVLDAEGRVAGAATVTAETAQVWQQPAASLIGFATDLPVGRAEFEVKAGRATAYAVVNDNVTSDAIALQVERVVPGPTDRLISGAALAPGQLGAFWSTDLRLFNPGSTAVDATIQSVGASREGSAVVPVPAKGVVEVSRALALLGFPEGTACALRVRAGASLLVAARTNNVDPAGIRKGTFSAQQFVTSWPAGLLGAGALGFFNGVDQSFNVPGVRTNLTVVGGPEGAAGELVLRDSAGLEHGRRAFARGPGEWGQQSVAEWFAPATVPGNSRVDVAVASGALDAFVSRIDNGSGDAITRPVALLGGGDCTKVVIASLDAEPKPIAAGVPTTFSWTVVLDPPAAELTSQSIRFDGEPEIELGKEIRSYVRSFDAAAARSATLTVRKGSCVKTRSLTFFVCGPLSLEPTTLPDATAFVVYPPRTITVPGATPPTTFTVAAGALPDGMSLSAAGELSGKPEEVGLFTFTVKAVDANGCVGTREYALRVFCPTLRIVPTTLPAGTVATPYTSIRFTVTGGSGTGTWSATGLPPGLALSTGGQLSGTPTAAGNYTVAVRFRDSSGCIGTASYTVLVCNTLVLTPGTLPAATAGTPYGPVPFNAAGATGAATWAVTTGSLPAGVTLNAGTGALSGTPTVVGTFPFTVTATDTLGCTGSVAVSLLVNCPVITVNPASLANGTAGVAYGPVSLSQTGGLGTVTYAVTAGALPAGTSLSAAGVLSGAPTVTGTFNFTVTATDVNGCTGTRAYTLTIACPVISLSPASLANGTAGVAFGPVALTQTGGVGAVSYAVTAGALPAGMTLGAAGVLGGTPTVVGPFGFTVTATDANGCTGTRAYSLTVDCPVINVNPVSVANGTAGVAYPGATFTQTGGVGTITWSLAAGTLPAGMSLAAGSGLLSGTPTVTGGFPITVRATDANGCFGERVLTLTIVCPTINVSPASLSNGTAGVVYPGATFTQTGGVGTIAWSLAAGTLPTGLSLNPVSGLLSGTPLQTGAFPITVRATDANGCTGDRALTLTILCPTIVASPGSPLGGIEGSVFGPIAFNQTGAVGAVAWTSTGTLPAGLTFSAAGVLTGTPAAGSAGSYTVTFTVTDQNLCQGSVQITFRICPVVTVGPNPLAAFLQSQLYAETLAGAGGVAPYTFAVTAGTLPAGVTLTGATGALSGTPTTLEAYDFTITATDTNGCTGSRQYTGRVCPVITVTTNLPNGVVGAAYSQTLAAAGSPDVPYAFSLTGGALPDGVTLVAGALTGNPTTPGSFTFTITATDTNGCAGSRTYIVEVCLAPTITPTPASVCALSTGNTASGPAGATTYAWVIANGTITSATNLQTVTYTAGASGNVALTLTVTSASSCSSSTSLNVPINANPATPTITGVPPGGVCADSTGNTASGPAGATTYAWSITGGTITSATNAQAVTYTAGASGSVNLTLVVTNGSGCSATSSATATINANPATPTITTATARVCTSTLGNTASGPAGATTYAWSITGGTITSATNAQTVTYTAGASGSVNLTLVVTNASGCSATNSLVLPIDPLPALLPAEATAFAGTFNVGFSQAFTASGGTGPFTYTLAPATPPAGLTFVGGVLSGTPTATGTFAFTVTATSAVGCSSTTQSYSLTVRPNVAAADSYSGLGNTQLYVTGYVGAPTTPAVQTATTAIGNDTPAGGVAVVAQTTACTGIGGSLTIDALGRFVYTTPVATIGVATCAYTATSDTGATGTPATATGTITITLANRVWYVKNDATGGGLGRSNDPFDTLPEAESASVASDIIFVHFGTTGTTPIPSGIILKDGQKLWGEGIGLTVAPFGTLVPAGSRPRISNGSGDAVSVPATAGNRQNVEIRGLDLTGSVNAVDVTASGTNVVGVTISDNTVSGAGVEGIDLNAGSTGAFAATVSTNAITATGNGIDARTSAATALSLDISNDTVVSALNGILISGAGGGTLTITGFANNTVDGNTGGTGISVNTARFDADAAAAGYQSVLGGATSVGTSGNPVGASGVIFTNVSGDLAFTDLDVFASNGSGLLMTGTGAVNAGAGTGTRVTVGAGVGVVEATNGQAVDITNATVDLQLSSIRSTNSLLTGVSLVSVADGSTPAVFSAGAGSVILNASGNDFNVDGGNATISYAGPITNTAGRSVSVINRSADTVTFTGAISDTGTGVFLNANGTSAITFSGGLVASTGANTAFTATGGGTVVVCDENPCGASGSNGGLVNTLTTTTGTALNVANTSIGANDLEFRSISAGTVASGPANGIVLNGTGSLGGLKVKGTGSAGTGGTIQRATGHGISLTSTEAVSLESVNVTNNLGSGIGGTLVRGLVLNGCSITGNGDNAAADESGVNITELTGTVAGGARPTRFVNTTISNNFEFEVQVTNLTSSVNLDDFRLENCTISSNGATGFHGNLVSFLNQSSAGGAMTLTVTGGSYTGSAPNTATGIMCDTSSTGGGDVVCNVTGAGFTNNNVAVSVSSALAGDLTFNVANNTATGNRSHGLNLFVAANATGIAGGRFDGNTVGTQGVAGSGSSLGYGIRVQNEGVSTANPVRVVMNNNVVQETSSFSLVNVNQGIAGQTSSTATNLTITNNTLRNSAARAIVVQQNNATDADSAGRTCVDISGNVMTNIPGNVGDGTYIRLRRLDANSAPGDLFNVRQTSAANLALVNGGIVVGAISTSGTMTYNGGACPQP